MAETPTDAGNDPDRQNFSPQRDTSHSQDQDEGDTPAPLEPSTEQQAPPKETLTAPASEQKSAPRTEPKQIVDRGHGAIVRYGLLRNLGYFAHNLDHDPPPGTELVVRTDRGVELGEVIANVGEENGYGRVKRQDLNEYLRTGGAEYPFNNDGKVLRRANQQDVIDYRHLQNCAREEAAFCRAQIRELNLEMKLVSVEHLLGGERIIFNFAAESRVDFRELVKRLAREYRTRIEMRQVGARDEARLLADYERCGQRCCCQQFIKDLKPVSMRMAKLQKATLDPAKISGRCGRLMCCLRFEDAGYEELKSKLPKKNTWVRTEQYIGKVTETHTLTQLVRLDLPDSTKVIVANEEITERDLPQPDREEAQRMMAAARAAGRAVRVEEEPEPDRGDVGGKEYPQSKGKEAPAGGEPSGEAGGEAPAQQKKKKRRRRRRKRSAQGEPQGATAISPGPAGKQKQPPQPADRKPTQQGAQRSQSERKKSRKPKRRRRRKKKDTKR